jgi:endonuclease YncB( thermonuclease family)
VSLPPPPPGFAIDAPRRKRDLPPPPEGFSLDDTPQQPETVTGEAVDGDTLRLESGRNLRLWGVDAPELKQQGFDRQGNPVPIGQNARLSLDTITNPNALIGDIKGLSYGRSVAPVTDNGVDVGRSQITTGNALAAPRYLGSDPARRFDYLDQERQARQNRRGMHQTTFQDPSDYRRNPLAPRETVAVGALDPTPWAGMRPEVEQQALEMIYNPAIPLGQVETFMRDKGGAMLDLKTAQAARDHFTKTGERPGFEYRDAPRVLTDPGDGAVGAAARGFANGVLPNMLEELGAFPDSWGLTEGRESIWNSDRRFGDIYANNLAQNESITGYDEKAHPDAKFYSEIAGGVVVPVGRVRNAMDLAKFGAVYGGISGLGQHGSIPERLASGAIGVGTGVITTVLGGKALEAAAPLIGKGWRWVRGKSGPELVPPAGDASAPLTGDDLERMGGAGEGGIKGQGGLEEPVAALPNTSNPRIGPEDLQTANAAAAEPGASVSQQVRQPDYLFAPRPSRVDAPLTEAQLRAADIQPGDVVPLPSNEVGSLSEAIAKDKGRYAPATVPNERGELTRQTVRTWNGAEVQKSGPIDLVGWLRLRGGLRDQGGELAHMGLNNKGRARMDFVGQEVRFGPLVNNESGMNFDDAAQAAWEAGYFPDHASRPDVNTFLDALRGTQEGWKRHFLADDLGEIDRFNAARGDRQDLAALRSEVGQVWQDRSVPAGPDAPFAPPEAYEGWPGGGPDFAGNINLNKLETPQDISRALAAVNDRVGGFDAATRGKIAQAETERLAGELGMSPETLLARRQGQALNAEEALAARQILAKSGNELVNAAKRIKSMDEPGDDALAEFQRILARHVAIQEQVAGATAEAGRALQQFRMLAESSAVRKDVLSAMIGQGGGRKSTIEAAETLLDAVETGPGVFNVLAQAATRPKLRDKLTELWVNSLLSGPQTHVVNMTSNTLTALGQIPEHLAAAAIGVPRRIAGKLRGENVEAVTGSEVGARAFGLLQGAKEGLRLFARSLRTGEPSDLVAKVEGMGMKAISGLKGEAIRLPTRLLTAEDELFKGISRRMELNGEAVRIAAREGLKGEDAKRRIAELVEVPTAEMLERSMDYARYLTFQRKLGPFASNISAATQNAPALKLFLPFVRTPTNLLKYAVERSPAAPLLKEWRTDFLAGGARRDLAVSRALLGTGLGMAIYDLALQGKITGTAPTDNGRSRIMYADGFQPYSIRVGDKWYSYKRLDPFSTTLGVAADLALLPEGMSDRQREEQTTLLVASIMGNLANKTWLSGISDVVGTIEDPERNADRMMQRLAGSLAVPTGVAQVARTIDPVARQTETMGEAIQARIPYLSQQLPARRDVWGEKVVSEGGEGPDILSPVWQSTAKDDPVNRELLAIGYAPGNLRRVVGGNKLSPKDYERYQEEAGKRSYDRLRGLINSPEWSGMDLDKREAAARKAVEKAREEARAIIAGVPEGMIKLKNAPRKVPAPPAGFSVDGAAGGRNVYADIQQAIPGVGITSGYRSPEYQADMRRRGYKPASNSAHLSGGALDLVPPAGQSMGWLRDRVAQFDPSAKVLDEGDHLHVTFPGYYGAPPVGGAKNAGLRNPNAGMPPPPPGFRIDPR